jgi:hypothetical protein
LPLKNASQLAVIAAIAPLPEVGSGPAVEGAADDGAAEDGAEDDGVDPDDEEPAVLVLLELLQEVTPIAAASARPNARYRAGARKIRRTKSWDRMTRLPYLEPVLRRCADSASDAALAADFYSSLPDARVRFAYWPVGSTSGSARTGDRSSSSLFQSGGTEP